MRTYIPCLSFVLNLILKVLDAHCAQLFIRCGKYVPAKFGFKRQLRNSVPLITLTCSPEGWIAKLRQDWPNTGTYERHLRLPPNCLGAQHPDQMILTGSRFWRGRKTGNLAPRTGGRCKCINTMTTWIPKAYSTKALGWMPIRYINPAQKDLTSVIKWEPVFFLEQAIEPNKCLFNTKIGGTWEVRGWCSGSLQVLAEKITGLTTLTSVKNRKYVSSEKTHHTQTYLKIAQSSVSAQKSKLSKCCRGLQPPPTAPPQAHAPTRIHLSSV